MSNIKQNFSFLITVIAFSTLAVFLAGCDDQIIANEERNKAIAYLFVDEFLNKSNLAVLDEIAAKNFVHQDNTRSLGLDDYKKLKANSQNAFPNSHFTLEDIIAEGNKVVIFWKWNGTVAKTGMQVTDHPGITILYFADRKVKKILQCYDISPFY